jgi:hypothetical protein
MNMENQLAVLQNCFYEFFQQDLFVKFNQNDQEKCSDISNADDRSGNTKVSRMNCKNVDISNIKVEFDSDTILAVLQNCFYEFFQQDLFVVAK